MVKYELEIVLCLVNLMESRGFIKDMQANCDLSFHLYSPQQCNKETCYCSKKNSHNPSLQGHFSNPFAQCPISAPQFSVYTHFWKMTLVSLYFVFANQNELQT